MKFASCLNGAFLKAQRGRMQLCTLRSQSQSKFHHFLTVNILKTQAAEGSC